MQFPNDLKNKKIIVYGLGVTGKSVLRFLRKRGQKKIFSWDDNFKVKRKIIIKNLYESDFIVVSPGININKSPFKKHLFKNNQKIISDIDLFFLYNKNIFSIFVTGTNGKSTTCKILEHVIKSKKKGVNLVGNIGKPILGSEFSQKKIYIIEISSYQLNYSKFIRPTFAVLLNISPDHLDWHSSYSNYIKAKFKIFSFQKSNDIAFLGDNKFVKKFKKNKFKSRVNFVSKINLNKIKKKIYNEYLFSPSYNENLRFVYAISKKLGISDTKFLSKINSFEGLPHRQEIIYKRRNLTIINDSKATSFEASKAALEKFSNIFWIVGGLPKKNDKIMLGKFKKKIIKAFLIGENISYFKKFLNKKIEYEVSNYLPSAFKSSLKEAKSFSKKATILLSPSAASYDQFKNFVERGKKFKQIIKKYVY